MLPDRIGCSSCDHGGLFLQLLQYSFVLAITVGKPSKSCQYDHAQRYPNAHTCDHAMIGCRLDCRW